MEVNAFCELKITITWLFNYDCNFLVLAHHNSDSNTTARSKSNYTAANATPFYDSGNVSAEHALTHQMVLTQTAVTHSFMAEVLICVS